MQYHYFTASEIASTIQQLGYKARIVTEAYITDIESAAFGTRWNARLRTVDPFFESMYLSTIIWTSESPFEWANFWNSRHYWSMAHVLVPNDFKDFAPDDDGDYSIVIDFTYDFSGGVSHEYLAHAIAQWLECVEELANAENIKISPPHSSQTS